MMHIPKLVAVSALSMFVTACSSKLTVTEIPIAAAAGQVFDGVPIRVTKYYRADIYAVGDKSDCAAIKAIAPCLVLVSDADQKAFILADPDHLYAVGVTAMPFADTTLGLSYNADGTLKQAKLIGKGHETDVVQQASTQALNVAAAIDSRNQAQDARKQAQDAATLTGITNASAAEKLKNAAILADTKLQQVRNDPTASAYDIKTAEVAAANAKLDANVAADKAGIDRFFPDVGPSKGL